MIPTLGGGCESLRPLCLRDQPLTKDLATYHSAVASGDPKQIGQAAGTLYSEISADLRMFGMQNLFGCYSPAVLMSLSRPPTPSPPSTTASAAAASISGKSPSDIPGLVSQAKPLETAYIDPTATLRHHARAGDH